MVRDIVQKFSDDEETKFDEIEEVTRIGKYEIEGARPMSVA